MFNYRNEAAFSKAVCSHLRAQHFFVQRIETGSTGRGVPDIFAISPLGEPMWLELKRVHKKCTRFVCVPWRPGQQAWLHEVNTVYRVTCKTLVAMDDCIICVSHNIIHKNDIIDTQKYPLICTIKDL